MNEMVKMVVVLTVLSAVAGGVLAAVNKGTASQIEAHLISRSYEGFMKGVTLKGRHG